MSSHEHPTYDAVFVTPTGLKADQPPPAPHVPDLSFAEGAVALPPEKPRPGFGWALAWCVGFVAFTQVPGAVVAIVLFAAIALLNPGAVPADGDAKALTQTPAFSGVLAVTILVTQALVIGVSWLVLRLMAGPDWKRKVALRPPAAGHVVLALAGGPGGHPLAGGAPALLRYWLRLPRLADWVGVGMEEVVQVSSRWPWAFAVLVIGLGPGVGEELWCRGFLGRGLVGRYGVVGGVLFTSFFFGLIHVDPCQGAMAGLVGLWLHFTYLPTRSLGVPILLHPGTNSLTAVATRPPG